MKPPIKPRALILSKRANVFYLEHVRVMQKDERVVYLTETGEPVERFSTFQSATPPSSCSAKEPPSLMPPPVGWRMPMCWLVFAAPAARPCFPSPTLPF